MNRVSSLLAAGALGLLGFIVACSSSSGSGAATPCNEDPWQCPTGQTCWPNSAGSGFECLNSAAGVSAGASCNDSEGVPTCGDGQLCYQSMPPVLGVCVDYCSLSIAGHGCAAGSTCGNLVLSNNSTLATQVCVSPSTGAQDSGTPDSSTSSPDGSSMAETSTGDAASLDASTGDAPAGDATPD
jgi:hypothetical protein